MKQEVFTEHFCMLKYDDCHREKHLCSYMSYELNSPLLMEYHFRLKQWFTRVILAWAFDRHFLKWMKWAFTSRERTGSIVASEIWDFKWKLEFWKIIRQCELDSFHILRLYLMNLVVMVVIVVNVIFKNVWCCIMKCQHLGNLPNSMGQYLWFTDEWCCRIMHG